MPVSAYPSIVTTRPVYLDELPGVYQGTRSPMFADGGFDFNLDSDSKTRRWVIRYAGLTKAEADTLMAHAEEARYNEEIGSFLGFNFTDRDGVTHSNVRYAPGGFRRSHTKTWIQTIEVLLIDYP